MSHSGDLLWIYQVLLDSEIVGYARRYHWRLFLLEFSNQNEKWNILALGSRFHLRAWDWVDIIWSGCNENLACRLDGQFCVCSTLGIQIAYIMLVKFGLYSCVVHCFFCDWFKLTQKANWPILKAFNLLFRCIWSSVSTRHTAKPPRPSAAVEDFVSTLPDSEQWQ